MANETFLAMTAAEIREKKVLPPKIAWMACHFSPYGLGLSNLPQTLPPHSVLMLDDRIPIRGHDSQLIQDQLGSCAERLSCSGIVLDFQRPDVEETALLADVLAHTLPCPVAVSHFYGKSGSFPVLLPPIPPSEPPKDYLSQWKGREIWLELALDAVEITVTEEGSSFHALPFSATSEEGFREESLCCHYRITRQEEAIKFLLWRTEEDTEKLLKQVESLGVSFAVGLYQEFSAIRCPMKIKTALQNAGRL